MLTLATVGYADHTLASFVAHMLANGIVQVLDIRQRAHSRKPGFSKTCLREALLAEQIDYCHLVDLGTPKPLRDLVRATGDYAAFFAAYEAHLAQQQAALHEALAYVQQARTALLCLEAQPQHCHGAAWQRHWCSVQAGSCR